MLSCVLNPKSDFGFKTKNWIFHSEKKGFCPFFAHSDSGDCFGLRSWGSDWGEAWTQSLQIFEPRFFLQHLAGPQNQPKKKKPALHTILECKGSWTESRSRFHVSAFWPHNTKTQSLCWCVWRTQVKIFHPCTLVRAWPLNNEIKVCSVWLGWNMPHFRISAVWRSALVNAWVQRACVEGQRSKYFTPALWLHLSQSFSPKTDESDHGWAESRSHFLFSAVWQQALVNAWVHRACVEVFGGQRSKYFTPALWLQPCPN
jgi:hypothetical protein